MHGMLSWHFAETLKYKNVRVRGLERLLEIIIKFFKVSCRVIGRTVRQAWRLLIYEKQKQKNTHRKQQNVTKAIDIAMIEIVKPTIVITRNVN